MSDGPGFNWSVHSQQSLYIRPQIHPPCRHQFTPLEAAHMGPSIGFSPQESPRLLPALHQWYNQGFAQGAAEAVPGMQGPMETPPPPMGWMNQQPGAPGFTTPLWKAPTAAPAPVSPQPPRSMLYHLLQRQTPPPPYTSSNAYGAPVQAHPSTSTTAAMGAPLQVHPSTSTTAAMGGPLKVHPSTPTMNPTAPLPIVPSSDSPPSSPASTNFSPTSYYGEDAYPPPSWCGPLKDNLSSFTPETPEVIAASPASPTVEFGEPAFSVPGYSSQRSSGSCSYKPPTSCHATHPCPRCHWPIDQSQF